MVQVFGGKKEVIAMKNLNSLTHSNDKFSKRTIQWNESLTREAKLGVVEKPVENSKNISVNRRKKDSRVDRIADRLVQEYQAPDSRSFFCKCAWRMSEYDIDSLIYLSKKPGVISPLKYFVSCCHRRMSK